LYAQFTSIGILIAAARGEKFFEDNSEAVLLMLQGNAASLAKQELNGVTESATVE
jgi:hypothetical protein